MTAGARGRAVWLVFTLVAIAAGIVLRCWQIGSQVLIDDEWHAIHALLGNGYRGIATHFGTADYSIPLTLYYRFLYDHGGLSEWGMRLPLLVAGIALLPLAACAWRRETSPVTRAIWVALLAISPVLVYLSRVARPYALTCLLTLLALLAFRSWWARHSRPAAAGYVAATFLAGWLHLLSLCFCLAPFVLYGTLALRGAMRSASRREALRDLLRLCVLGVAALAPLLAALLPPLLSNWGALAEKAGTDAVTWHSAWRTLLMLCGVRYAALLLALFGLAGLGAVRLWRRDREFVVYLASIVAIGTTLIVAARPAWIQHPGVLARYVMPVLPVALLFSAEGASALLERVHAAFGASLGSVACAALIMAGPIPDYWYAPNQFIAHAVFQYDPDPAENLSVSLHRDDPVPAFYRELAQHPPQSLTIIEMPWLGISDALYPWYQKIHRQNVLLGLAVPECSAEPVFGEYPESASGMRLRQFVHLSELMRGQTHGADYLVVRPQPWRARAVTGLAWPDMQHCLPDIRAHFGAPVFEDAQILVFALPKS